MFNQWGRRHGPQAFAWGGMRHGHGWSGWGDQEAEEGHGPGGHHGWHHRGHHGGHHGPGRGPQGGWHGGPGPGAQFGWQRGPAAPPWMRHGGPGFGPPLFWMLWDMRRGFGGGPGRGPGRGPGGPRAFGRGDLKYQLLALLTERPKHGYEMIKELEDQAGGFYTPSAGAVYPSLQLMEDRGWITSQTQDGKKVYTITDAGRAALQEHQQQ